MAYDYSELLQSAQRWLDQAVASGWLKQGSALPSAIQSDNLPGALFERGTSRPLIVAFMGGTGVGKSSLLNRLAGAGIAKTGVIRPTSREVTLYHHESITIRQLPANLSIESVSMAPHRDSAKKNIVWIDMPDFDSIEQSNHRLVLQWLPHIDVLIYVVSPERYKDDKAWRLLLAEGGRHAWIFVLNQWDRGRSEQFADFNRQLAAAGFVEPIIFKTVCGDEPQPDEFASLSETILSIANQHTVSQLENRVISLRMAELTRALEDFRDALGNASAWQSTAELWHRQWSTTSETLNQGFVWPIQQLADYYADHASDLVANPFAGKYSGQRRAKLWDPWAQTRFDDALDEFAGQVDQLGLPISPIKKTLSSTREKAEKLLESQLELAVRQALAKPGTGLQRAMLKGVRIAEIILPLAAMSWVAYQVFIGYYHSNQTNTHYLGTDFAIHSSLLIAIAWFVPWFVLKKIKPSLQASALRGLKKGMQIGLDLIGDEVAGQLDRIRLDHTRHFQDVNDVITQLQDGGMPSVKTIDRNSPLKRMLLTNS